MLKVFESARFPRAGRTAEAAPRERASGFGDEAEAAGESDAAPWLVGSRDLFEALARPCVFLEPDAFRPPAAFFETPAPRKAAMGSGFFTLAARRGFFAPPALLEPAARDVFFAIGDRRQR